MSIAANRTEVVRFTGDQNSNVVLDGLINATSPAMQDIFGLSAGDNQISIPLLTKVMVIIPPVGNAQTITFKGVPGDTGVRMSKIDYSIFAFDTVPPANFILNLGAGATVSVRIIWL